MEQKTAEILITTSLVFFLSILIFLAGPLRKVMNAMDSKASQQFVKYLFDFGKTSAFMLTITNITVVAMIPYLTVYGFNNWLFISGVVLFIVATSIAKVLKLPLYKSLMSSMSIKNWPTKLKKMHYANTIQAVLTLISVCLMAYSIR